MWRISRLSNFGCFAGLIQDGSAVQSAASRIRFISETGPQMTPGSQAIFPRSAASLKRQRREVRSASPIVARRALRQSSGISDNAIKALGLPFNPQKSRIISTYERGALQLRPSAQRRRQPRSRSKSATWIAPTANVADNLIFGRRKRHSGGGSDEC